MTINSSLGHLNVLTRKQLENILNNIDGLEKISSVNKEFMDALNDVLPTIGNMYNYGAPLNDTIQSIVSNRDYLEELLDSRYDYLIQKTIEQNGTIDPVFEAEILELKKARKQEAEARARAKQISVRLADFFKDSELFD